jgi:NO-binding membrane sensor protein with MHYT domain
MTVYHVLCILVLMASVALPIVFRSQMWLRYLVVISLLVVAICSVHFGLGRAARNLSLPDRDDAQQHVEYGTAWNAGRFAMQEKVDSYRVNLLVTAVAMAILALTPRCPCRRTDSGTEN